MLTESIRPFPWKLLEPVSRAEVSALRDAKDWAVRHVDLNRLPIALSELLGTQVTARIDRARPIGASTPMEDGVGVVLARAADANLERSALVEAEAPLAAAAVSRALARALVAPVFVRSVAAPPPVAGAFAALLATAMRRAHAGNAVRVLCVGGAQDLEADLARREPERWSLSLTVLVGDDAYAARIVVPRDLAIAGAAFAWDRQRLLALGSMPLALPVVACATCATAIDVATLQVGDAFVPPQDVATMWLRSNGPDAPETPVLLAAPTAELGLRTNLGGGDRLVLGGTLEPIVGAETHMAAEENKSLITALGDVPVVVRVEIGEAVMTAREWASLGRGDVVTLSRHIGGPVVLRVSGVPVARGELVELDGDVAVRILERVTAEETNP